MSLGSCGRFTVRIIQPFHHRTELMALNFAASERPLPRAQRRGAVIILGMLALARRSVVADRADVLMRIGLGKLGQVKWRGSM